MKMPRVFSGFRYKVVHPDGSVRFRGGIPNTLCAELFGGASGNSWIRSIGTDSNSSTAPGRGFISWISPTGYTGVSVDDTMASHPGWTELTSYTASTRPPAGFSGITLTTTPITGRGRSTFVAPAGGATLKGFFITDNNVKGGSAGKLFAAAGYPGATTLVLGPSEILFAFFYLTIEI